jgi:hypothetical protein
VTLRKELRLMAFENRVPRRIYGPKKHKVRGGWRKLHNEELHNLYSSPSIILMIKLMMKWARHVVRIGKKKNLYRILMGKPEGNRALVRPRRRWVDNIKMDLRGFVLGGIDWIDLVQDQDQWRALVNTVINLRVP